MVSCASCVCKRVFEVVSRQVVSVCVHCYRESSRVRQPPQVVANTQGIKDSVKVSRLTRSCCGYSITAPRWQPNPACFMPYPRSRLYVSNRS
jgi:hypothetical protein